VEGLDGPAIPAIAETPATTCAKDRRCAELVEDEAGTNGEKAQVEADGERAAAATETRKRDGD
jgi:hypothetical protein